MLAVLSRFVQRPEPPTPPAAPFDDGLTEIARLLELEESARDDMKPTALRVGRDATRRFSSTATAAAPEKESPH
jgi:hypothetical protein